MSLPTIEVLSLKLGKVCVQKGGKWTTRFVPHSLNKRLTMHWAEAKKWHDGWFSEVAIAARLATRGKAMVPYLRARVIVDYQVVRLMDVDNLHGSAKPLLDALKDAHGGAGVIVDDSPEHIELVVRQCKVGKINEQGVLLTIEKI